MKEEDSNPLEPVGDEPIEARIVAWVLGDASAFEAAELERLCAANPELEAFRRRMLALHGLLGEAGDTAPDDQWKLSPDRRSKVEALFNAPSAPAAATLLKPQKRSSQPWIRQALMATAACLVLAAGFRYVFAPAKNTQATLAVNESVGVMSARKPSEALWAGRDLPMAEGYASSQPVLPEIADADGEILGRTELVPNRPMGEGLEIGDKTWRSAGGKDLADNSERGSAIRSRAKAAPAKPATPPAGAPAQRYSARGPSEMSFAAAAPPAPAITAAPTRPEVKTEIASSSETRANTDFIRPVDGQTIAGVPANDADARNVVTGGLRSGDGTITRNNIDSVLNNPNRVAQAKGEKLSEEIAKNQSAADLAFDTPAPPSSGPALAAKEENARSESGKLGLAGESTARDEERSKKFTSEGLAAARKAAPKGQIADGGSPADLVWSTPDESIKQDMRRTGAGALSANKSEVIREFNYSTEFEPPADSTPRNPQARAAAVPADPLAPAPASAAQSDGAKTGAGYGGQLAQRETIRREDAVTEGDKLFMDGRNAYANGDYQQAQVDRSRELSLLDESMPAERSVSVGSLKQMITEKEAVIQRYKASLALYDEYEKTEKQIAENNASPEAISKLKEKFSRSSLGDLASKDHIQNSLKSQTGELLELKKQLDATEGLTPAPPKPAPVPADETIAATEPFSTFSLHVSDASFKLAKAALDRGERLSADQIRTEEFYNAFDYGDPAPASGEPVACAIEQAAHPVLPQRNIVRVAMRVGSAGRGQGQPLNLTLLLDNSGSMEREDRHEGLKAAIAQLASLLQPGDTVTLAGFSRTPHLLADRLSGAEAKKLVELVDKLPSEGGTNLEEALKLAGELAIQRRNPTAQNRIVLLTDGAANLGNAQPDDLAQKVAALRQQGIAFDAAGIGAGGLNDRMLEALTRHGNGRYYIVNDPKDADANFARQLAGAFRPAAENVKVQVHFNPDRVSRYKLIGFEKHRLNTEDFHNDAVDAAELAADEAGVALYQVETRPDGSGEIGEVSVRFRDTASDKMVENTWTIPHDEKTPAFDQARPSIQLATISMLAAEKLRGGPLADATDFTTLSPVIARVKNYYSTSSRVGELTGMTGKLR
ncbi:von Willebrand factor type A domain-containing protein [Luteolibacter ambystomatis]|uniref:von Willebrand factor type A domain-containing protein n=1 Tax=Luteolibacter ambystomatis TaxID=2824561 RepID=A0A975IZ16_9BACT|nr:von Willebrand factor type A domain-containing protein [Luteolibacter ambystomatis]QUE50822.1 von Willebrand factor type A domain-containing protein [Luteolibacter ambystomatis]